MGPISLNQSRKILLEWFKDNKIGYDPKIIEIKTSDSYLENDDEFNQAIGFSVFARTNIPEDETIAQISKKAIISPKKGPLSNLLDPLNISGELALVVTVMYELSLLEDGPFWGYLQSLPYSSDIPLLWPEPDQKYLIGSQVHDFLVSDYKKLLLQHEFLKNHLFSKHPNYFHTRKTNPQIPSLKPHKRSFQEMDASSTSPQPPHSICPSPAIDFYSFPEFVRVYSLITSRAFEVDAYLGICLVPFADLFNHKSAIEDVHVVSDTDVCLACGELVGCEHTSPHPDQDEISNDDTNSIVDEFSDYSGDDDSSDSSSVENLDEYRSDEEHLMNRSGSDSDYVSDDDQTSDKSDDDDDDVLAGEELPLLVSIDPSSSNKSSKKNSTISNKKSRSSSTNNKHDDDYDDAFTDSDDDDESHFIEITSIKPIKKSKEIFNTYGMHSNAYFLNRYGFYDPHNDQYDTSPIQLTQIYQKKDKLPNVPEKFLANHAKFSLPILKSFATLLAEISNCQPELDSCEFDLFCDRMKLALSQPNFSAPQNVDFDIDSCSLAPPLVSPDKNSPSFKPTPLVDLEAFGLNKSTHSINLNSPICSPNNNFGVDFYFCANGYPNFSFLAILSILCMNADEIEPVVHSPLNEKIKSQPRLQSKAQEERPQKVRVHGQQVLGAPIVQPTHIPATPRYCQPHETWPTERPKQFLAKIRV
ncbi:Ribosomal lysine N-methyltransferase 3 [Smittium culicis]|uniref:Ribosomal lysine N-methyltransferase 3 n=1 Tax=Smittium culicis TaxID=133412 RepID=A0A1R1Y747_9FUNG|nr:Ribosomal lysine N-methyltransferase 3 [Smittium culicis]